MSAQPNHPRQGSIPGISLPNGPEVEFSPPPITDDNLDVLLDSIKPAVPNAIHAQLGSLGISAREAHRQHQGKLLEARAEYDRQHGVWVKVVRAPLESEFTQLEAERQALVGRESALRTQAAVTAATLGMRFVTADLQSVEAFQAAVERDCHSAKELRGASGTARADSEPVWWFTAISSSSPLLLSFLTAIGLLKILTGTDLQSAMQNSMSVIALALGLGTTIPSLLGAYRYGWMLGTSRETSASGFRTLRSTWALVLGGFAVMVPTVFLACIDALAVQALAADLVTASSRQEGTSRSASWLPLIGFAFMGAAAISKVWSGYCDCVEAFQEEQVLGKRRAQSDKLRMDAARILAFIAEADLVAARMEAIQPTLDDLAEVLGEQKFEAELPPELVAETELAANAWIGESGRFWATAISAMRDLTFRSGAFRSVGTPRKSFWQKLFKGRRS